MKAIHFVKIAVDQEIILQGVTIEMLRRIKVALVGEDACGRVKGAMAEASNALQPIVIPIRSIKEVLKELDHAEVPLPPFQPIR